MSWSVCYAPSCCENYANLYTFSLNMRKVLIENCVTTHTYAMWRTRCQLIFIRGLDARLFFLSRGDLYIGGGEFPSFPQYCQFGWISEMTLWYNHNLCSLLLNLFIITYAMSRVYLFGFSRVYITLLHFEIYVQIFMSVFFSRSYFLKQCNACISLSTMCK